ncbi:regulator of chromosome condensation, putative [Plasmodium ovale]|uniref:Regulator of chromosome condensation, putative n=1 Tax=Plasmodium ovale TaxID=36330 RepID=A0A1D3TIB1_PLAOA|nr:regulator of chromosome condensation, putative [Plasmodium ovale]
MGQGSGKHRLILHGTNEFLIDKKRKSSLLNIRTNVHVKNVYSGPNNIIIIYENDDFEIVGLNNHGQLGLGDKISRNKLSINPILSKQKIRKVSCGYEHIIALMCNYNIFVWGNNQFGQLGIGNNTEEISTPLLLYFNEKVVDIACGKNHSVFLTECERKNINFHSDNAGIKKRNNSSVVSKKEKKKNSNNCLNRFDININDDVDNTIGEEFFQRGTSNPEAENEGEKHQQGEIGGNKSDAEIDQGEESEECEQYEECEESEKCEQYEEGEVECGEGSGGGKDNKKGNQHEKAKKTEGDARFHVYACGAGSDGKLGFKNEDNVYFPKRIDIKKRLEIGSIYAGCNHNALLTYSGKMYTWGYNKNGELGVNYGKSSYKIKEINLNNDKIVKVSLGKRYSACLTKSNAFYVWGNGMIKIKKMNMSNLRIKEFSCNEDNIIILTEDNKLLLIDASKKVHYMNKLLQTKLSTDKKVVDSIQYNFVGNGCNYLYAHISMGSKDVNKTSTLSVTYYKKRELQETKHSRNNVEKENVPLFSKNERTSGEQKKGIHSSEINKEQIQCSGIDVFKDTSKDIVIYDVSENENRIITCGVYNGYNVRETGETRIFSIKEESGEKRKKLQIEKMIDEIKLGIVVEDATNVVETEKVELYGEMEGEKAHNELQLGVRYEETVKGYMENEPENEAIHTLMENAQMRKDRYTDFPFLKARNYGHFLSKGGKYRKGKKNLEKCGSYSDDSLKMIEVNATSDCAEVKMGKSYGKKNIKHTSRDGHTEYDSYTERDKNVLHGIHTKYYEHSSHRSGRIAANYVPHSDKANAKNVNDIEYLINNINNVNIESINVEDISIDKDFLMKHTCQIIKNNANYIEYLTISDSLGEKLNHLDDKKKSSFNPTLEEKYIQVNIMLFKELKKQKKINIVYSHILNKLIKELYHFREEKKYLKKKISLLQKMNNSKQDKHIRLDEKKKKKKIQFVIFEKKTYVLSHMQYSG